ncbi:MAG: hypothetical protein KH274_02750 [Veillonella sp. oral taxon 780]|nr:hypothetical protein [Veillonella sp. oral taxon 780]
MMGYIAFMLYATWTVAFIVLLMLLYACVVEWKEDRDERKRQEWLNKYTR